MAWREAKASAGKFLFVVFGVAVGVGALAGVRGFSAGFHDALRREARTLMAGDLTIRVFADPSPQQQQALDRWLARGARMTPIVETVSMVGAEGGAPVLVSVKAVDPAAYPYYGTVKLDPPQSLAQALDANSVVVSEDLLLRLDTQVGGTVKLGSSGFRVAGIVRLEPDRMTGSLNVGPRMMLSQAAMERSGLMTFGSRASHRFLFKLPPQGIEIAAMRDDLKKAFPEALVSDYRESHPIITRTLDHSTTFLSLVSLIALIVGALGVATAIHAHVQQRLDSIAILKCLGARSGQIIRIYTLQTAMLGLLGGLGGVAVGAVIQRLFPLLLTKFIHLETLVWNPSFALEGLATGLLVSLLFTVPPLLGIRDVKPASIFRREMPEERRDWRLRLRRSVPSIASGLLILAGLGLIAGWLAESARMGAYFIGGLAVALLVLGGVAWLLLAGLRSLLRRSPFRLPVPIRHGLANLYRPGNHAPSILVSLGIGVMFTLSIYLVQKSLLSDIAGAAPPNAPNVFLINITEKDHEGVEKLLAAQSGLQGKPRVQPYAMARLLAVDDQSLDRMNLQRQARRHFQPREVSWYDKAPEEIALQQGAWWSPDEKAPMVAVGENAAAVLKIKPGSTLRWTALGREFTTRVAAVYRMKQVRFGPVSEYTFNRAAFSGLAAQYVGTVRMKASEVSRLQRDAWRQFPTVTVINAADVLAIAQEVIDQVALVVRFISAFAILAGAIILAATVAGTRMRRVRESAVLKTLGARRAHLVGIFSVEFAVLGASAGLMGGVLATLFARLLLTRLLNAEFRWEMLPNLATVILTAVLAVATGWLASLRVLSARPLEVLRDE
jgi:putative ABC transport system permease protein